MSRKDMRQASRIASLTFKVTGAKQDSEEVRRLADLMAKAQQAMTALSLLAIGVGFVLKKTRGSTFIIQRIEHLVSDEVADELGDELVPIYEKYGAMMLATAKMLCPVKTGRLMNSLAMKTSDDGVRLTSDVDYYWVQEAKYSFVAMAVAIHEPAMMAEIDMLIARKQSETTEVAL